MMTLDDRARALEPFGFTPRQARFIALVALHSGYCLRRQYVAFAGIHYGKHVRDFLDGLVARKHAERFRVRADRGHVYRLHSRTLYRALGQEDNRNRREASAALMARRVMLLDFVLAHGDVEWVATEADKVDLFADRLGVPHRDLPQRVYASARPGGEFTTRFFPQKLPVAVTGDPPVAHFVYLAGGQVGSRFDAFLQDHARLFGRLSTWTVVALGPRGASPLTGYDVAFERFLARPAAEVVRPSADLRWYLATRQLVEHDEFARLSVADIDRFRGLRARFRGAAGDEIYTDWRQRGDAAFTSAGQPSPGPRRSLGHLVIERLPFDYAQFGSLPGVA